MPLVNTDDNGVITGYERQVSTTSNCKLDTSKLKTTSSTTPFNTPQTSNQLKECEDE